MICWREDIRPKLRKNKKTINSQNIKITIFQMLKFDKFSIVGYTRNYAASMSLPRVKRVETEELREGFRKRK